MKARALWQAGFRDLVSVIPPNAELSPTSSIKPEMRGKVPGYQRQTDGLYIGYSWVDTPATPELVTRWDREGNNIGLLGTQFPAVDIDVDQPQLAEFVAKTAIDVLGNAPVRLSRGDRRLLVYRTENPFPRMAIDLFHEGKKHTVEVLGEGRQYLVSGTHPSGAEYRWGMLPPLWELTPDDLVRVTVADIEDFFDAIEEGLEGFPVEVERSGSSQAKAARAPVQEHLVAPSTEKLLEIVEEIPNDTEDRDYYIKFMHAVRAAAGDDVEGGAGVFWSWAKRWQHGENDIDQAVNEFRGLKGPFQIGWPWILDELRRYGKGRPSEAFEPAPEPTNPRPAFLKEPRFPQRETVGVQETDRIAYTEEWAADQVLPEVEGHLRYVASNSTWYFWTGHRWITDETLDGELLVREELRKLSLMLEERASVMPTKKAGSALRAAARKYQSFSGINSVVKLLRARLSVRITDFDADTMVLNTPVGAIDLRDGKVHPPDSGRLLASSTLVGPAPGDHPMWSAFLEHLTGGDEELERFLQMFAGYALTGNMSEKVMLYGFGSRSDTGKSTLIKILARVLGDYATTVSVDAFINQGRNDTGYSIAQLPGVRLVTATEPERGQQWNESLIKAVTGGDKIQVRPIYGRPFTFQPQFKLLLAGNAEPQLGNVEEAMLRRVLIVPMNNKVHEPVDDLDAKIVEAEGPQILAWAIRGCLMWKDEGLPVPEAVRESTQAYGEGEDMVAEWLESECQLGEEYEASRAKLYGSWKRWCRARDLKPGSIRTFKQDMEARLSRLGLEETRVGEGGKGRRGYRGIRLMPMTELPTTQEEA